MSLYVDDYGIVDCNYIVHACMIDPCVDHPEEKPEYGIWLILHVGHQGHACSIAYPQRSLRDIAFEKLVAMVQRETIEVEEDEED